MKLGHRPHDRQSEARPSPAIAAAAHEPLEYAALNLRRDTWAVVLDDQRRSLALGAGLRANVRARRGVAKSVLDQVEHHPVEVVLDTRNQHRLGVDREL